MDIGFFLRLRINFIKQFYETASYPFLERKRKIEGGEDPFVPAYSDDGEPLYLVEWTEADDSIQVVGHSSISMLSAALGLYLRAWQQELGEDVDPSVKKDRGYLYTYNAHFSQFGVCFDDSPADMSLLEEITLARNRIHHMDHIAQEQPAYVSSDFRKIPSPVFINELERSLCKERDSDFPFEGGEMTWLLQPTVHVTAANLLAAVGQVEKFSAWFEDEMIRVLQTRRRQAALNPP